MNHRADYPFTVHKASIHNGIEIAYMDIGKGPKTILFIHGLANYAPVWKYQLQDLSEYFRCVAIDLPGNGLSSRGDYPYSQVFYSECVKRFTDALKLDEPILAGHSMGGQIALMMSLRYPAQFRELILIAPAGIEYFSSSDKMITQQLLNLGDFIYSDEFHLESAIRESFEHPGKDSAEIISQLGKILKEHPARQWKDMTKASANGMLEEQINKFLPSVVAKTLLIFGEKDRLIPNRLLHPMDSPAKIAAQGAALIPDTEMHLVANAGHFVQIEQFKKVNTFIRHWAKV